MRSRNLCLAAEKSGNNNYNFFYPKRWLYHDYENALVFGIYSALLEDLHISFTVEFQQVWNNLFFIQNTCNATS